MPEHAHQTKSRSRVKKLLRHQSQGAKPRRAQQPPGGREGGGGAERATAPALRRWQSARTPGDGRRAERNGEPSNKSQEPAEAGVSPTTEAPPRAVPSPMDDYDAEPADEHGTSEGAPIAWHSGMDLGISSGSISQTDSEADTPSSEEAQKEKEPQDWARELAKMERKKALLVQRYKNRHRDRRAAARARNAIKVREHDARKAATRRDGDASQSASSGPSLESTLSTPATSSFEIYSRDLEKIKSDEVASIEAQAAYRADGSVGGETRVLQENLRMNSKVAGNIGDSANKNAGRADTAGRERKSGNEDASEGWATTTMLGGKKEMDASGRVMGAQTLDTWKVEYYFKETEDLTKIAAKRFGYSRSNTRDEFVIRYDSGLQKWVDANNELADTSGDKILAQTFNQRKEFLRKQLAATKTLRDRAEADKDDRRLAELEAKFDKLAFKLDNVKNDKAIQGNYIFVMNAAGEIFAGEGLSGVRHHSSFLAGGAVAAAGEIGIQGGVTKYLSNTSGHYAPGPAYLWQVVKQMQMNGAPLDFKVEVYDVAKRLTASALLEAMNPYEDSTWFDAKEAVARLNERFAS